MRTSSIFLSGIALALAGCTGVPIVYHSHVTTYYPGEYSYAGDVFLDVKGNPYKVPQEEFNRTVADMLSGSVWGYPTRFVSARAPDSRSPYKVVWVFDPPWYASYDRMCSGPETIQPVPSDTGATKVTAALCRSDYTVSYVYAGFAAQVPEDPAFRDAMHQIELALLPAFNQHIRGNDENGCGSRRGAC
jgi:hypothetical protein